MDIKDIILSLIINLILTLVIELSIAIILRVRETSDWLRIMIINCITNPIVNCIYYLSLYFLYPSLPALIVCVTILELLVWIVEFLYFKNSLNYKKIHPLLLSFILNAGSFFFGLIFL